MNLQVYEPISQEISYRTNLFRHSNLQPLDRALDTSKPIPQGTIVSVKKRVLDPKGEEKASASELLRIKSKLPFSPMVTTLLDSYLKELIFDIYQAGIEVTGKSLTLSTASYTVERVAKAKRDFEVFNFLKVMHADLKKVE
ncbi:hypothetical protein C0992_003386 [Termitomyces sp. T32_za158]|nr:hypothetical protein C0992_003386 [Termitomyces sp. T32_za158]